MDDRVLCVGEALIAMAPDAPGPFESVNAFYPTIAGSELNTAVGLARLGVPAAFAGAVGGDGFGAKIRARLLAEEVDVSHLAQVDAVQTGFLVKAKDLLDRDPDVLYYRQHSPMGAGLWRDEDLARDVPSCRWVHTSGITWMVHAETRRLLSAVLGAAKKAGIPISFDVNLRQKLAPVDVWRERLSEVLPLADCLICGDSEGRLLAGADGPEAVLRWAQDQGFQGREWLWRKGADGADAWVDDTWYQALAWPVPRVVDTTGAGDGFTAGYIAGRIWGWDVPRVLKLATLVGGYAVASPEDHAGYPKAARALAALGEAGASPNR